jgi:PEP-CTERM motif
MTRIGNVCCVLCFTSLAVTATPFSFDTGNVTNAIGMASRPDSAGKIEIEAADDFVTTASQTMITSATFTGLLTGGATVANIGEVVVEIYRVFPNLSDVGRTSGPPVFSTAQVPTRVNSPSDVELDGRDSSVMGDLSFTTAVVSNSFTALNSVLNGINPTPGQMTGGEGAITGQEVTFTVNFTKPFNLPADHYFFVPQVQVTTASGQFFWLSGTRPVPFPPGTNDLQAWMRNENLDPDWLRVGTDIVGAGTFNGAFSVTGDAVPEPSTVFLALLGGAALMLLGVRRSHQM